MKFISLPTSGELVDSTKKKFWRWEQRKDATLITTSGNVGADGRESSKKFASKDKADREVESKHYAKLKSGFRQPPSKANLPILWQTWLTDSYTGFLSMDVNPKQNLAAFCRHTGKSKKNCEVVLIDLPTGEQREIIRLNEFDLSKLQFHDDNLIIQFDNRIMRLNIKTGKTSTITDSGLFPFFLFEIQGDRILYSTTNRKKNRLVVQDLKTKKKVFEHIIDEDLDDGHRVEFTGALSPNGDRVAFCIRESELEIHDIEKASSKKVKFDFGYASQMLFHPSGKWVGLIENYNDQRFRVWSAVTGKENKKFEAITLYYPTKEKRSDRECQAFAFDASGKHVLLVDRDRIQVVDFKSGTSTKQIAQRHAIRSFRVLCHGKEGVLVRTDRGVVTCFQGLI